MDRYSGKRVFSSLTYSNDVFSNKDAVNYVIGLKRGPTCDYMACDCMEIIY